MSRRARKRRPKPVPVVAPAQAPTEINWSRLHQIYAHMRGRGVVLNFIPLGPFVDAKNPEEMVAKTEAAIVAITKTLLPN